MALKFFHALFAAAIIILLGGSVVLGWRGGPFADLFSAALFISFWVGFLWYCTWRDLTDCHKNELLDKVDDIEEDVEVELSDLRDDRMDQANAVESTHDIQRLPNQKSNNSKSQIRLSNYHATED